MADIQRLEGSVGRAVTYLESEGVGVAVCGPPSSVRLVLDDAQRHGEPLAWLLTPDGRMLGVDPYVTWEVAEVDRAEG